MVFLPVGDPRKYGGPLPTKQNILCQLAEGLKYIHGKRIFHRDLKPENVLIRVETEKLQNGGLEVLFKWGDFGLSKIVNTDSSISVSGIKGTEKWFAPEILNTNPCLLKECHFSQKSDVFASGLVYAYILLDGVHPFGKENHEIIQNLLTCETVHIPSK